MREEFDDPFYYFQMMYCQIVSQAFPSPLWPSHRKVSFLPHRDHPYHKKACSPQTTCLNLIACLQPKSFRPDKYSWYNAKDESSLALQRLRIWLCVLSLQAVDVFKVVVSTVIIEALFWRNLSFMETSTCCEHAERIEQAAAAAMLRRRVQRFWSFSNCAISDIFTVTSKTPR